MLSEPTKIEPDPTVVAWLRRHRQELWLPTPVVAELRYGAEKLPPSRQREELEAWIARLLTLHIHRLASFDVHAAEQHGSLRAKLKRQGKPMGAPDSYIAAIALSRGAPLATRNTKDFRHTEIQLIDPWIA